MSTVDSATDTTDSTADHREKDRVGREALNEMLRPIRGRLLTGRILGALSSIVGIAPYVALVELGRALLPAATGGTIDTEHVRAITLLLVTGFSVQVALVAVALLVTQFADLRLGAMLRDGIIDRIARAPLSWFDENSSGRVRKAVQDDTKALHTLVAHAPVEQTIAVATPLALAAYAFVIDWRLGLLAIAAVPLYLIIQGLYMVGMGEKTAEMDTRLADVSAAVVEFADGIAVVKAFGRTGEAHGRYVRAAEAFGRFYLGWVGPMMRGAAISEAVVSVPVLMLLNIGVGSLLVRSGAVTAADVIATAMIALVLPATMQTIGNTTWAYQTAGAAAVRLRRLLETEELGTLVGGSPEPAATALAVRFDHVSFAYGTGDGPLAVDSVDLELPIGTVTALTGRSGSGKSTLALLLARFHDPTAGRVLIRGRDLREIPPDELYRTVSFVLQEPQLLRASIRDNVRLAVPDAPDDVIWAQLEKACVADEVRALPHGLDTVFGDEADLSGGQKQRLQIARALLADAPVLILDEATSATDPDSEAEIQRALSSLAEGRTVLVIAHRPESVCGADQVIRLDQGRITRTLTGAEATDAAIRELMTAGSTDEEGGAR
jgi:ATP-binding cassette subfamily B protein